jgi:hypothetical protein
MFYIWFEIPTTSATHSKKSLVSIDKKVPVSFRVCLLDLRWASIDELFSILCVYVYFRLGSLYPCLLPQNYNNTTNLVFGLGPRAKTGARSDF